MYDMKDILPWSLIYGEQNKKHDVEIKNLKEELNKIARLIVRQFLVCCLVDLNNPNSDAWSNWRAVKQHLTLKDLLSVEADLLKDLVFPSYAYDIRFRVGLLEKDLISATTR